MDDAPEIVERAVTKVENHLHNESDVPFLKTCPTCNQPLRANEGVTAAAMESYNGRSFTDLSFHCADHYPAADALTDRLLTAYGVVLLVTITEPSPDCDPADRDVTVEEVVYDLPPAYD